MGSHVQSMNGRASVLLLALLWPLAARAGDEEASAHEAELLVADAGLAAAQGEVDAALALLARAHRLRPAEADILFELTRLRFENGRPLDSAETAAFLATAPSSDEAHLLAAYVLAQRGDLEEARGHVATIATPTAEVAALREKLGADSKWLAGRAALLLVGDSNVMLVPDATPSGAAGVRLGLDAAVEGRKAVGTTAIALSAGLALGQHLNARRELAPYDFESMRVGLAAARSSEQLEWVAALDGVTSFADSFQARFSSAGTLSFEGGLAGALLHPGIYGRAGYRDFGALAGVGAFAGERLDERDGLTFAAGLRGRFERGVLRVSGRAGMQSEGARAAELAERGLEAALAVELARGPARGGALFDYRWRDYDRAADGRGDHQLVPALRGRYQLAPSLALTLSYVLVRNLSSARYSYTRHVGELGVEGVLE